MMNVKSWVNLGLSMLKESLTRTAGTTRYQGRKINRQQENNAIINDAVDEILLNETKKLSAANHEAPEFLENDDNDNDLYQVENMSLDEKKND